MADMAALSMAEDGKMQMQRKINDWNFEGEDNTKFMGGEALKETLAAITMPRIFHERTRTILGGYIEFCKRIHWPPIHILLFLSKNLDAEPVNDTLCRIGFKGKLDIKKIENLLTSYLENFVICKQCGSMMNSLVKVDDDCSSATCDKCGAERFVPTISVAHFHAAGYGKTSQMAQ